MKKPQDIAPMAPDVTADRAFLNMAFAAATAAAAQGEVPVGAVLVRGGQVLAVAGNRVETETDPTAHAEILALRAAAAACGSPRLTGCDLYVTLEPCPMCAGAIAQARIRRVIFAAYDPKGGGVEHGARVFAHPTCHHQPEVIGGVQERRAQAQLRAFFRSRRPPSATDDHQEGADQTARGTDDSIGNHPEKGGEKSLTLAAKSGKVSLVSN